MDPVTRSLSVCDVNARSTVSNLREAHSAAIEAGRQFTAIAIMHALTKAIESQRFIAELLDAANNA
jgi:hypothetical protein